MTDDNRNLPEWERAFDEYAKNNAPDLLPGILQKINASQNTGIFCRTAADLPGIRHPYRIRSLRENRCRP